jgi:hypothetical protein
MHTRNHTHTHTYLDEATHVEEAAEVVDDLGASREDVANVAVHDHVQVTLP